MSNFRHPNWKLSGRLLSWVWTMQNVFPERPKTLTRSCVNVHGHIPGLPTTNDSGKNHRLCQSTVEGIFHLFKKLKDGVYKKSQKPVWEVTMIASQLSITFRRWTSAGYLVPYWMLQSLRNVAEIKVGGEGDFSMNESVSSHCCCDIFIQKILKGEEPTELNV